jgi:hypothetical protein
MGYWNRSRINIPLQKNNLYILILFILLFSINYSLEKIWGIYIPLIHAYMDDLLAIPVIMSLLLLFARLFYFKSTTYLFPTYYIVLSVVYLCVYFEWYLASKSTTHTADWLDCVCYSIGGVIFWQMQQFEKSCLLKTR